MQPIASSVKFSALLPEAALMTLALVLLVAILFRFRINQRLVGYLVMTTVVICGVLVSIAKPGAISADLFLNEPGAQFYKYVFLLSGFLTFAILASSKNEREPDLLPTYACLVLSLVGMMFLSMASSLLSLFVSLELTTLPLITLTSLNRNSVSASGLSQRFLIVTILSSYLILFGFSFLFGLSGASNLIVMKLQIAIIHITNQQIGVIILLSIVSILTGILIRAGLIPFHSWSQKLNESLSIPVAAFMAAAFLTAILVFFAKIFINGLFAFYGPEMNPNDWGRLVGFMAFVNLIFGSIQLYRSKDLVSLMSYSIITQAGFVLVGLVTMRSFGLQAVGFYLFTFVTSVFGVYALIDLIRQSSGSISIDSVRGLSKSSKLAAYLLIIFLLSLAGLPMLSGFVGKFSVLEAAFDRAGADRTYHWMYILIGSAAFGTIVTFIKYARVSLSIFKRVEQELPQIKIPAPLNLVLVVAALATILFGIYPDPLLSFAKRIPEAFGFIVE